MIYMINNKIQHIILCILMLYANYGIAQVERPPVLILNGGNNFQTHFDANTKLTSELLNKGLPNEATIEFWVMAAPGSMQEQDDYSPWKLSNLEGNNQEFTIKGSKDRIQLTIGNAVIPEIALEGDNQLGNNEWHHIALVFESGETNIEQLVRVYIDGIQHAVMQYVTNIRPEHLYFTIAAQDQLSIAEYRAWNRKRTQAQVEATRYRSFFNQNSANINTLASSGLVMAYVDSVFEETSLTNLPKLETLHWSNKITTTGELVRADAAHVISRFNGSLRLAELTTMADHPIFGLRDVLLEATDGNGADYTTVSGGRDGVTLRWPHLRDVNRYIIARRNIADASSLPQQIEIMNVEEDFPVSTFIEFFDSNILPNELYEYTVTPNRGNAGIDNGFVFSNGNVEGIIQTPSNVATRNALVKAIPENGDIPGSALEFREGDSPIGINDVSIFEQAKGEGTIEFWYRTPTVATGKNIVFKLDIGEVQITDSNIKIISGNPTSVNTTITYLTANKPNDTDWHHYAFTFGSKGGSLYIDGGIAPTDGATGFTANATTTIPFIVGLNRTSQFSFNAVVHNKYQLDEMRIWKGQRSTVEIGRYKDLILAGIEPNLLAYYRFDLSDRKRIYNQALETRGSFKGTSYSELRHLDANEQAPIVYGVYTTHEGLYSMTTINAGRQGVDGIGNDLSYRIIPSRANSDFMPEVLVRDIERSLTPRTQQADFTDVSALPISGRIVYRIPDPDDTSQTFDIPSLAGTGLELDGLIVNSIDPQAQVRTNSDGVYVITASPGRHTLRVANNILATSDDESDNGDQTSLDFNGSTGYAQTNSNVRIENNDNFTWSGFIQPDIIPEGSEETFNPIQTILHWGSIRLELRNNDRLYLVINDADVLNSEIPINSRYVFFAISADPINTTISLTVNNNYKTTAYIGERIDDKVYLGAENIGTRENPRINFSRTNIDVLEYRTVSYTAQELRDLRDGNIIENDEDNLKLTYTFEHRRGTRAVNIAVNENSGENNFLSLQDGASFNNTSSSGYLRRFNYEYRAIGEGSVAPLIDPVNDSQYVFNITEAVSSINFENLTRRSFIGNIVVPCDYGVGDWTGTITRTDIAFPAYSIDIDNDNFNVDRTIFEVHGLVPGQYRVDITNTESGRVVQSPILDLRRGNLSYDFQYRNEIESETTFYALREGEMQGLLDGATFFNQADLDSRRVDPSCSDSNGDIHILDAGSAVLVSVNIFERYGQHKCVVEGAQVNLGGDMIIGNLNIKSNDMGNANFISTLRSPNFVGDHTRNLTIAASHNGRSLNDSDRAYLIGAQRGNSNFTLINPTVGYVLHDPPGDKSSSTLSEGATYTYNKTIEGGFDIVTGLTATPGGTSISMDNIVLNVVAPLGVGAAAGFAIRTATTEVDFELGGEVASTFRRVTGNGNSITLGHMISTPTESTYVGQDADVFVGTAQVLTFGGGRNLIVTDCVANVDNDTTVMTAEESTPFVVTRQQIEDQTIPDLQRRFIERHDELFPVSTDVKAARNSLALGATIEGFSYDISTADADHDLANFKVQIDGWKEIIRRAPRDQQRAIFDAAATLSSTTDDLRNLQGEYNNIERFDRQLSFSAGPTSTYQFERQINNSEQIGGSVTNTINTGFTSDISVLGIAIGLRTNLAVSGVVGGSRSTERQSSRVESFTFEDDDAGDQFDVLIRRDPIYDTPMFFTNAGQSMCPFESGTKSRRGVEISVDKTVGFGTGDETILYTLTLRNTQTAEDATPKKVAVGINASSNDKGAFIILNESPILEPTTRSEFTFGLDPSSPTGVQQEIVTQLRIGRGTDAPENISYDDIGIQILIDQGCESKIDYQLYREDEYAEEGVVPFDEIFVTSHFSGPCISEIEADLPAEEWVVNGRDNNELDFRFRIPEIVNEEVDDDFKVLIEYVIPGNNTPFILEELTLAQLNDNIKINTGYIEYTADVSSLVDGTYRFRVTPFCDDGGANLASSKMNPTPFVTGTILRISPVITTTTPETNRLLEGGQIGATFSRDINPVSVNSSTVSLRGILGGVPSQLKSAEFNEALDQVTIPHQAEFNLPEAFTLEMWINPSSFPSTGEVAILEKGTNYSVVLTSDKKIKINGVTSTTAVLPFEWTHIAAVYDNETNTITIYFNGASVGSGTVITDNFTVNEEAIQIAKLDGSKSYIGLLDEIRMWKEKRSPLEIVTNMDKQLIGNEVNLQAYFVFDDNALEGSDGTPDEAIRDFTGNAVGTTATGTIAFVTGEGIAAPLDITRMVQDLQFNIQVSNNNTVVNILPVFTDQQIEGARLTAMISNRIEDPTGNRVVGKSWDFIVNRNVLEWSLNNTRITQQQGTSSRITTIDLDNSNGAIPITYRFVNLPVWLSVEKRDGLTTTAVSEGSTKRIEALAVERDLEFVVAPFLNPGLHSTNVYIETFDANTGLPLGTELFQLEVNVFCDTPLYTTGFNANQYLGNMNMTGKLLIEGVQSMDEGDIVAAYLNGEFRGSANVGSNGVVNLSVFGNNDESGTLSFKVWDKSECTEYNGIEETYTYAFRSRIGSLSTLVNMTVGSQLSKRIPIVPGFQEVSFNVRDNEISNVISISSITGLAPGDQIMDAVDFSVIATVTTDGTYSYVDTNITTLDIRKAYLIRSTRTTNSMIQIQGIPVDIDTNIEIAGDNVINSIAYLPNDLQRVPIALRSLTSNSDAISNGDRIERRGLSAEYTTTNGWTGSLTHLTPGLGYLYTATNNGVLNYRGIVSMQSQANSLNREAQLSYENDARSIGWEVNPNAYAKFMYMTAVLVSDDLDANQEYTIAAFVADEIRGVSKAHYMNDKFYYFIGVGANEASEVAFKLFDGENIKTLDNVELFDHTNLLGEIEHPYELRLTSKVDQNNEIGTVLGLDLKQNIPNPMKDTTQINYSVPEDGYVDISLYNILGQKVHTFVSNAVKGNVLHSIHWNGIVKERILSSGIYIYKLNYKGQELQRKLIIE